MPHDVDIAMDRDPIGQKLRGAVGRSIVDDEYIPGDLEHFVQHAVNVVGLVVDRQSSKKTGQGETLKQQAKRRLYGAGEEGSKGPTGFLIKNREPGKGGTSDEHATRAVWAKRQT